MLLDDELLTVDEIADGLKVNQQTVRNWIDRGSLKAVRLGPRRVRVKRKDLQAFVDLGAPAAPVPEPSQEEIEAWTAFGMAMARTARKLRTKRSQRDLVDVLSELADVAHQLASILTEQESPPESEAS